jgi:anaerobic ribonucleoside-triphosphate reductase activating protein
VSDAAPSEGTLARVHALEPRSRANGPGARFVIWMQGCTLGCAGCFNPRTHADAGGQLRPVSELLAELAAAVQAEAAVVGDSANRGDSADRSSAAKAPARIEGLTLSGGEPMQQAEAAAELLAGARALGLSTLVFSGYTREEIEELPHGKAALASIDVLVDGRYRSTERLGEGLRGSRNQRILLLSDRYTQADVEATPVAEIRIARDGQLVLTGVNPLKIKR